MKIKELMEIQWPADALLLVDRADWRDLCDELGESPDNVVVDIEGASPSFLPSSVEGPSPRTVLQVADMEVYDRAAYRRVNQVVNERLRPVGTRMDPFKCESCGGEYLFVSKKARASIVCDGCGSQAERTTT